jgi:hypothetical protein
MRINDPSGSRNLFFIHGHADEGASSSDGFGVIYRLLLRHPHLNEVDSHARSSCRFCQTLEFWCRLDAASASIVGFHKGFLGFIYQCRNHLNVIARDALVDQVVDNALSIG